MDSGSLSDVFEFDPEIEDRTPSETNSFKKMVDEIRCMDKSAAAASSPDTSSVDDADMDDELPEVTKIRNNMFSDSEEDRKSTRLNSVTQ